MACAYGMGLLAGMIAVHAGYSESLAQRDRIVADANANSAIIHYSQRSPWAGAALDFLGNSFGATATAAAAWWPPAALPIAVYRGWIGGIVSVDSKHRSRLLGGKSAAYYIIVVSLQLTGFILTGGAGANVGISVWRPRPDYSGRRMLGAPVDAFHDAGWIFLLALVFFALGSIVEFLW